MQLQALHERLWNLAIPVASVTMIVAASAQSTTNIALNTGGIPIQTGTGDFAVSRDGRCVAFKAGSPELPKVHAFGDIYRYDRATQALALMSTTSSADIYSVAISGDGRFVAYDDFYSAAGLNWGQIYVVDSTTGNTVMASVDASSAPGNDVSARPKLSSDGRFVTFVTTATNLVPGDTNNANDVVVRDLSTNVTTLVSVTPGGGPANSYSWRPEISDDGRWVAFMSHASDLVPNDTNGNGDVFLRDLTAGVTTLVSLDAGGLQVAGSGLDSAVALSPDGRFVAFSGFGAFVASDTNGGLDVYLRDTLLGTTERISVATNGTEPNGYCQTPAIAVGGRFVAFTSHATNLLPSDANGTMADVYVRDRKLRTTTLSNVSTLGIQSNLYATDPMMIGATRTVAFWSPANNLIPGQTVPGDFARDPGPVVSYCTAKINSLGCTPVISATGTPSASSTSPFVVSAAQVVSHKMGLFLYGYDAQFAPFQGGWLCVAPPIKRTGIQNSNGSPPPADCSGTFAIDFNAYVQSGIDPLLVAGAEIFGQYWYRDPASAGTTGLTGALSISIQP